MDADAKVKLTEEELIAQMRWVHNVFRNYLTMRCYHATVLSSLQGMRLPRPLLVGRFSS